MSDASLRCTAAFFLCLTMPCAPARAQGDDLCLQVLPSAEELAWLAIPWHDTLRAGLFAGAKADRPVLLWAMNGHPLGCT